MRRLIYEQIKTWGLKPKRKPLIVLGARQVGKTYALKYCGEEFFQNYHYVNFEKNISLCEIFDYDLDPLRIIQELERKLKTKVNIKTDLLIFDEIQTCPKAITSLKYFCEDMPELALASAGSLLGVKYGEASFPVGKVDLINMFPMTFTEFLLGLDENEKYEFINAWQWGERIPEFMHKELFDLWKQYLVIGGLPEVISTYNQLKANQIDALTTIREKQSEIINVYMADMAKHCGSVNAMHIERVFSNIPEQLARRLDGNAPKFTFKNVVPKVKGYDQLSGAIDWLRASNLIIKVLIANHGEQPIKAYTEENRFKLFLYDVGILGALGNLDPITMMDYNYGTYKGYIAENFIAQEFSQELGRNDQLYAWEENKSEVEFIRTITGKQIPIEVKSGFNTKARSIDVFAKKYDSPYKIIFSANNFSYNSERKVCKLPIYLAKACTFTREWTG